MFTVLLVLVFISAVNAALRNVTIDDEYGDLETKALPVFLPAGGWTQGAQCAGCAFHPDKAQAFGSTWHDTTHHTYDDPKTVQFNFSGTALTVYCILPNPAVIFITSLYDLQFFIDGNLVGNFSHPSDSSGNFIYQVPVFTIGDLANSPHFFSMTASSKTVNSTILFDYAVYTTELDPVPSVLPSATSTLPSPASASPSSDQSSAANDSKFQNNLGAIVGGVLGGLAFLVALVFAVIYLLRRRRRQMYLHPLSAPRYNLNSSVEPFVLRNPPYPMPGPPFVGQKAPAPMWNSGHNRNDSQNSWSSVPPRRHKRDPSLSNLSYSVPPSSHSRSPRSSLSGPEMVHLRQQVADLRSQHQAMVEASGSTPGYKL